MTLPHHLLHSLNRLTHGLAVDPARLVEEAAGLAAAVEDAVSGYAGLQIIIVHSHIPITLTLMASGRTAAVVTSLQVALPAVEPRHEPGSQITFLSTVPGALVDLAADLTYALDPDGRTDDLVRLDVDLLPAAETGLTGLDEFSLIHRAAGFLIGQGHDPQTVHHTLTARAAAAGLTTVAFASQLLRG